MTSRTAKQQYWFDMLQDAKAFEGSLSKFAQANNIAPQSLYRWRNYFKQSPPGSAAESTTVFTRVVKPTLPDTSLKLTLGGAQLEFTRLPNPQWLAELIVADHSA